MYIRSEALELFAGALDYLVDTFKMVLVDDTYTFNDGHDRLDDVGAGSRIATFTLAGKDATDGVLTADDPANLTPAAGKNLIGLWLYHDTGVDATSELLVWYDRDPSGTTLASNTAVTPTTGGEIIVELPGLPYGLLKL